MIPNGVRKSIGLLFVVVLAGCASMHGSGASRADGPLADSNAVPTCTVELRVGDRVVERTELALDAVTRVQDVIDRTRADRRFRRMHIEVYRPPAQGAHGGVKMASHYEAKHHRVTWDTDYAIHPGDRIVITKDTTDVVDRFTKMLLGPIVTSKL